MTQLRDIYSITIDDHSLLVECPVVHFGNIHALCGALAGSSGTLRLAAGGSRARGQGRARYLAADRKRRRAGERQRSNNLETSVRARARGNPFHSGRSGRTNHRGIEAGLARMRRAAFLPKWLRFVKRLIRPARSAAIRGNNLSLLAAIDQRSGNDKQVPAGSHTD